MMSRGYTGERFLVGFYSDPHDGGYFPCVIVVFLFVVFDGNITSKTQKFLLSWSDSRCYTVFVLICTFYPTTFCLAPLSVFSIHIKFFLLSCSPLFGHCIQKEFKVTLKYHTSCEVDHTCVWSQSLKNIAEVDIPGNHPRSLPFPLHLLLSGLIWWRRSAVSPYGDEGMLIMWHHIWCVWSVCG